MRGIPLWIDALCINQDDIDERNSQVLLMGELYRHAAAVLSWLGGDEKQEDHPVLSSLATRVESLRVVREIAQEWQHFTLSPEQWDKDRKRNTALKLLSKMSRSVVRTYATAHNATRAGLKSKALPAESSKENKEAKDDGIPNTTVTSSADIMPSTQLSQNLAWKFLKHNLHFWKDEETQQALIRLFSAYYWQRVWVVQEIVLASGESHFYMSGDVLVSEAQFDGFVDCTLTLFDKDQVADSNPQPLHDLPLDKISEPWFFIRFKLLKQLRFYRSLSDIHHGRIKPGWMFVLYVANTCHCSDPHDAVYGLLELLHTPPSENGKGVNDNMIIPDYTKPVAEVYIDWAVRALKESGNFELLIHAGRALSNVNPVEEAHSGEGKDVYLEMMLEALKEVNLSFTDLESPKHPFRPPPMDLNLPSWVPNLYYASNTDFHSFDWATRRREAKGETTGGEFTIRVSPDGFLNVRGRRRGVIKAITQLPFTAGSTEWMELMSRFCLDYVLSELGGVVYPTREGIPVLQAIFRLSMRRAIARLEPAEADPATGKALHRFGVAFLAMMVDTFTKDCDLLNDIFDEGQETVLALGLNVSKDLHSAYRRAMFPAEDLKALLGWDHLDDAVRSGLVYTLLVIHDELTDIFRNRYLFVTGGGHIGHAPPDVQPDDLIYEVEHCPLPLIFRPASGEQGEPMSNQVTLIGACDVAGISDELDDIGDREYNEELVIC
ncbi:hypothetical protein VTJ04DRAFT_470 [Mycothermus thermophilus]|uniref:uncharacterized protein n=1 Tax=Humicola insolens TaxID=85995 RepID=UPI00374338A7